jgi:glycosyltransferase involved in cell wall biosynthesis
MRIAQIAPLYERVPPRLYGGTERVVANLTDELVRQGHDVTLFASGDSITTARLESTCPHALRLDAATRDPLASHMHLLATVYGRAADFEVIHSHVDYLCLPFARASATPTLLTLHGRLDIPELEPLYAEYREVPLVSISNAQRLPLPSANWIATVYHGLSVDQYRFNPTPEEYLLFLGRISPEKCPDAAIGIALRAGVRLRIAAKVDPVDEPYFARVVRPLLDHPLIEFLGEKSEAEKVALLANARALLFPIDWPEPFGLVMIEALACGTPVIARRRGSVPEVVRDGVTGFVCETDDEMVAAIGALDRIDRRLCRTAVEQDFTATAMTDQYVALYDRLAAQRRIARTAGAAPPVERSALRSGVSQRELGGA